MNQKGAISLVAPVLLLLIIALVIFILISQEIIGNPLKFVPLPGVNQLSSSPSVQGVSTVRGVLDWILEFFR